jgi:aspartyl-tRNA(Asn)/glutamyl-tRNA(Gln) amidotransferase subunit A
MAPEARLEAARLEDALGRIAAHDGRLKCFIDLDVEGARADVARAIDGPLSGLLIGIKGNIAVKGLPNTGGSQGRRTAIAQQDAPIVAQLRQAGAVILGTLNMHEGALGATTDNLTYGRCINPWKDGYSPGGSSGGSGAAIAAGFVDAALGSDTMGSIRLPAAYCGVFGWKPAGSTVPQDGVIPLSHTLDQVGPLAKDFETLALMAKAMGGPGTTASLNNLSFAAPRGMTALPEAIGTVFAAGLERVCACGGKVEEIDLGLDLTSVDVILAGLLMCEIEGAREWASELAGDGTGLSREFAAMLRYGANSSEALKADAYAKIAKVRTHLRNILADGRFAGFLTPTASHTAFSHETPAPMDQAYYTMWANMADLPAISAPMGLVDGLPVGLQCMAAPGRDDIALGVASLFPALELPIMS